MGRRLFLSVFCAVAVSLVGTPMAIGHQEVLFPEVTYESEVQFTPHGPVTIRVVRGPRPVGLYRLRTVLSNESVLREETLSSMQRRLSGQATMVGVNGDFSRIADGRPTGILLRDGVLVTPPHPDRSSAGITLDGLLDIRRVKFYGMWRGTGQRRVLNRLNKEPATNGTSLFTSDWGRRTPSYPDGVAVVLAPAPAATPNVDLSAPVASVIQGGAAPLTEESAVLVARGSAASILMSEAALGTTVTYRLMLSPDWTSVADAIGGGPVLVRDGAPVYRSNEAFTTSQIAPRHPRTAVGQLADGRLVFVVVDGRQPGYSVGMTTFEMAQTLVRLGAVRGMQLDSGGSSTLAFDGKVLNSPSDGRERPVPTALMLQYYGVFSPPPAEPVLSPNGDGRAEEQRLSYKVVRPSSVSVTLTAPGGAVAYQETVARDPGSYQVPFPPPPPAPPTLAAPQQPGAPAEGRWTLTVSSTDDQGLESSAQQRFWVNSTLGFLRVRPARLAVPHRGARVRIRWTQTRGASVRVTVETPDGVLVRTVATARLEAGTASAAWNGRLPNGKLAPGGPYVVRVAATNRLGTVDLDGRLTVRRVASPKR